MSIASEITRLQGVKSDILTAISDKGVTVPAGSALDDCPGLIADIPTGPSGVVDAAGNVYPIVTIGTKTWIAANFRYIDENIKIGFPSSYSDTTPKANYISDNGSCGPVYNLSAGLYIKNNINTILPGWKFPSFSDYSNLKNYLASDQIKKLSKNVSWSTAWNGNNSSGFNLIPTGYSMSTDVVDKLQSCYLMSEVTGGNNGYCWKNRFYSDETIDFNMINDTATGLGMYTIRLVKA